MRLLSNLTFRLRALMTRDRMQRELGEEMAFHLDMESRQLVERGWSPAAAASEARRRFGVVDREEQRARDSWGIGSVVDTLGDVRVALRQLGGGRPSRCSASARWPSASAPPWPSRAWRSACSCARCRSTDEARLQVFWSDYNWRGVEFDFVKERQRAFSGLAAFSNEGYTLRVNEQSSTVLATVGSAELFDVLGAAPLVGRAFKAGDDRPGAAPVTVVSYGFWQQELGADPHVVGRRIEIDGAPVEVVGVMPRGFYFPSPAFRIWRPLMLDPSTSSYEGNGWLVLVGRERPGLSRGELDADIQAIARSLGERFTYPEAWDKTRERRGDAAAHLHARRPPTRRAAAAGGGAAGPGHCLRERGGAGAGAHDRPRRGTGAAHRARRRPRPSRTPDRHRIGRPVGAGRRPRRRPLGGRLRHAGGAAAARRGSRGHAAASTGHCWRSPSACRCCSAWWSRWRRCGPCSRASAGARTGTLDGGRWQHRSPPGAQRARGGGGGPGGAARGRRGDVHALGQPALLHRHRLRVGERRGHGPGGPHPHHGGAGARGVLRSR